MDSEATTSAAGESADGGRAAHVGQRSAEKPHLQGTEGNRRATRAVIAAMLGNLCIAAAKFLAAGFSGSSAMLSEGIHSVLDTGNQALLLVGDRRSRKPPDDLHPFGHGRELYFWSLVVAIVLFGVGGGLSIYQGIIHLRHAPEPGNPVWNYVVLAVAFAAESASLSVALRELRRRWGKTSLWRSFRASKDPRVFVPLAEDIAALLGLTVALIGVLLSQLLEMPVFDAVSSMLIGLILAAVALVLATETRGLLVGERADARILRRIHSAAARDPAVKEIRQALTIHTSPDQIYLNLAVDFRRNVSIAEMSAAVERLKRRVEAADPRIARIFVEVEWHRGPDDRSATTERPHRHRSRRTATQHHDERHD